MSSWEEKYHSYQWHTDSRATALDCTEAGSIPKSAVTGGPATLQGLRDAIAIMIKCLGMKVTKDIAQVLKKAGANFEGVSQSSQTQTDLRKLMLSIDASQYKYVQAQLLEICERRSQS